MRLLISTLLFVLISFTTCNNKCSQSDQLLLHHLPNYFSVRGKASGVLQSEKVMVGFTVETVDQTAAESLRKNAEIVNNSIEAFKQLGLKEKEFSTFGLSVYPSYIQVYNNSTRTYESLFEGYKVRNSINIDTQQIELAGKIIDNAVTNGVTNIDNISYSPLEHSIVRLREKLLADAVANSELQAKIVLDELNYKIVSVKNVQVIEDTRTYYPNSSSPSVSKRGYTQAFAPENTQVVQVDVSYIIEKQKHSDHSDHSD